MKKLLSFVLAVTMLVACFVIPTQVSAAMYEDAENAVVIFQQQLNPHPDSNYWTSVSLNGNNIPAEYMVEGYTFKYDLIMDSDKAALGIVYPDDANFADGEIWNTIPWEGDYYYGTMDFSDNATAHWYTVEMNMEGMGGMVGHEASHLLMCGAGTGNGNTAYMRNFRVVDDATGEIVWSADAYQLGDTIKQLGGNSVGFGYSLAAAGWDDCAIISDFDFGISGVTVDEETGYWRVDAYVANPGSNFKPDAWFGIYDASVTQEMLSSKRGAAGLSSWAYVSTSDKGSYNPQLLGGVTRISIDSTNPTGLGEDNIWRDKYGADGLVEDAIGLEDLKLVLFLSDGQFGIDGYIVAAEAPFSLVEGGKVAAPETEAPATQAPATEAPATQAPVTEAPATQAPVTEAPATEAPAPDEFSWGISNVYVDAANNEWKVDLYVNNPGSKLYSDAWFGIYAADVDQAMLDQYKGDAGFSAWDYIFADRVVGSTTFSISNTNGYYVAGVNTSNIWRDTYPMFDDQHFNLTGCEDLQVILFYTDGAGGYGYQIVDSIPLSLANTVETEAPDTEAPDTEAPDTEAPEVKVPTVTITNVTVNLDGTWRIDAKAENVNDAFWYDAWFGVYDRSVTQDMLYQYRGAAGLSTWAYLKTSDKNGYGDESKPAGTVEFYIDSTNPTGLGGDNIWNSKYPSGLVAGCEDLQIILFYSDGKSGDGYKVAAMADVSLAYTEIPAPEDNADELVGDIFFVDGEAVGPYYGLVQYNDAYYYVDARGVIVKDKIQYVLNDNGYGIAPGNYGFDAEGKLYLLSGLKGECYYFEDGTKAPSYYGLVTDAEGNYYYIDASAKTVKGKAHYILTTNGLEWADGTPVAEGWYDFDAEGKMINPGVRNGIVGDFYYIDDVKQPAYTGLVEVGGNYYYVADNGKIVKDTTRYVLTTNGLVTAGFYTFDANGCMVID